MKTLVSALVLSATFMGSAYAGELDYPPALDTHSAVTRAQVEQELARARANGELAFGEEGYAAAPVAQAGDVSRAEVKAELAPARRDGLTASGELEYPPVAG